MKRNDVLVLLAGFIATGLTWRYQTAKWGIPVAIASAMAFLFVHFFWKEHPLQPADAASIKDSFNPTQSVTGTSITDVGNATATSSPIAIAKYEEHHHYPPRTQPAKHVPPTVECVRTKTIRVTEGGEHSDTLIESTDPSDPQALVAYFRNIGVEGRNEHPDIYRVHAQIIYRDSTGNEIEDVPLGLWMGRDCSVNLKLNDTQGLVLMVLVSRRHSSRKELKAPHQGNWKTFAIGQVSTIDVCLTSHNDGRNYVLLRKTFQWMDEDGHIDAVMLPP